MNTSTTTTPKSYATVTQNQTFPTKDQAVVIDSIDSIQIKDYAQALSKIIDPKMIRFISRISNNRICIFLATKLIADELVDEHKCIVINGIELTIRSLISRNKRVILSNVCPIIPHVVIESKLNELKITAVSPITFLRAGLSDPGFNHILSFRRQVFVTPEDFSLLPERIQIDYEDTSYWVYLSSDTMTCFLCKKEGHVAQKCPEGQAGTSNDSDKIYSFEETIPDAKVLPFKRPHPPTESSSKSLSEPVPTIPKPPRRDSPSLVMDEDIQDSDSSEDGTYKHDKNTTKKHRKIPTIDTHSSYWHSIEDHIMHSNKNYPLTPLELKTYLEHTYGIGDIRNITLQYTENIQSLIDMFKDLIPMISNRSLKNRITRIVTKLKTTNK